MAPRAGPVARNAAHDDVPAIRRFGEEHVGPRYAPLIGAAVAEGSVVVTAAGGWAPG